MDKPYFCDGSDAMVELEGMVDKVGLRNVLYALAAICNAKGEHLRSNWQDVPAAKVWERDAQRIDKFVGKIESESGAVSA